MLIIKSILIEGIWGYKTIQCNLQRNVNIIIGKNGVGKTTVLNLISSVINVDIDALRKVSFDKILIVFYEDENPQKSITFEVKRYAKNGQATISYDFNDIKISKQNFNEKSSTSSQIALRYTIHNYINLTWLSINRKNLQYYHTDRDQKSEIDKRLEELFDHMQDYYYRLISRSMSLNEEFKSDVINLFLYDKDIDMPTKEALEQIKEENINKDDLINMFSSLGLSDRAIKDRIETHFDMIEKAKKEIFLAESSTQDSTDSLNDSSTKIISLYLRTRGMLDAYHSFQEKTEENYALLEKYLRLLADFMPDKRFTLSNVTDGNLQIEVSKGMKEESDLSYKELSSGEKQILILLTEALLQQGKDYIYLADEPEMSLHMNWQEIIISAITQLNDKAQIIVATHSPEIAQDWNNMIIDLNQL